MSDNKKVELSPNKWLIVFDGCNHERIVSDQFRHSPIETQFNPKTMLKENVYVCPGCANGEPGFCHNSVLHRVAHAQN
jgi:hypothetical protein